MSDEAGRTVVRAAFATDVGRVRSVNEDRALVTPTLFAVADGMGGHVGGEVAARVAVESLNQAFDRQPSAEGLLEAVVTANQAVWNQSMEHQDLRGMGTTLTAAALVPATQGDGDVLALANVGDSRAYVFGDRDLKQITFDHSLAEERVRQGELTEQEAAVHPHRHILTRALGIGPGVDVDLWELRLRQGDRLLLCSDGLSNEVPDGRIGEVLREQRAPEAAAQALVDEANRHGGNDNITVVIVDVMTGQAEGDQIERATVAAIPIETGADGDPKSASRTTQTEEEAGATTPAGVPGGVARGASLDDTTAVPAVSARPDAPGRPDRAGGPESPAEPSDTMTAVGALAAVSPPEGDESAVAAQRGRRGTPSTSTGSPPAGGGDVNATAIRAAPAGAATGRSRRQSRRITMRVLLFILLIVAVVAAGYFVLRWYATDTYYVGVDHGDLVVYQGRPGGVLWFQPRLVYRSGVTTHDILAVDVPAVKATVAEPSEQAGRTYIHNLHQEAVTQRQLSNGSSPLAGASPTVASTTTTTATTVPPPPATPTSVLP